MDMLASSEIFLFEGFRLDRRGLFQRDNGGAFIPMKVGSRALDVLRILVAGTLLSRSSSCSPL
jgi:hypothetical protein